MAATPRLWRSRHTVENITARPSVADLDRLVHRSEILGIDGDSYRLKEAKERQLTRSSSRRSKKPKS